MISLDDPMLQKALNYSMMQCQSSLQSISCMGPELQEWMDGYTKSLKEMIDWLAPKVGMDGLRLY